MDLARAAKAGPLVIRPCSITCTTRPCWTSLSALEVSSMTASSPEAAKGKLLHTSQRPLPAWRNSRKNARSAATPGPSSRPTCGLRRYSSRTLPTPSSRKSLHARKRAAVRIPLNAEALAVLAELRRRGVGARSNRGSNRRANSSKMFSRKTTEWTSAHTPAAF